MSGRIRVVLVAVLVSLGVVIWWIVREESLVPDTVVGSGTVEAIEADLGFQVPGRVEWVGPREGDAVSAGQAVARLDRRELLVGVAGLEAGVDRARETWREMEAGPRPGEIARAEAVLRAAQATLADHRRDLERSQRLFHGGAISQESLNKVETANAVAEAKAEEANENLALLREGTREERLAAQRARLREAEASLERARVRLEDAVIVAPFEGVVAIRHREPGEVVFSGSPVVTLRNVEDRWVRLFLPGDAVGRVRLGQEAEIRGDAYPDRSYRAEVVHIGSRAEFTPRNVQTPEERVRLVYPVRVRVLDDPDWDLKPGLPVDVVISTREAPEPIAGGLGAGNHGEPTVRRR